ncbi:MAG: PRC-barrel domain-containing protein [Selenomonas sp.]|uniref:PRC-barrel domain-containing protein n=1 Tax=Selenomonas sp. TaxID=2053611 RepID=UPI0025DC3E8C|nr:PRC-barrel domain-containing protein [Selenomonas sp.]MCI6099560.1 PRC-barrel domain-containing protein [Selenomonas sp.]MCI6232709.1 PRC-barrel domain-containing protein [Selenomonas sp.]
MKKSVEILGLPIISITEGRELGMSKTLLIDAKNGKVAAITIEDEDWYRGVKLIPYESVIAIGDDAVTITNSENILKLDDAGDYETLLDENIRVIGTKAITKTGSIQGKISELFIGDDGTIEKCEITAPDGTSSEVIADQISIFGKQVTVIDPTGEKKNELTPAAAHAEKAAAAPAAPAAPAPQAAPKAEPPKAPEAPKAEPPKPAAPAPAAKPATPSPAPAAKPEPPKAAPAPQKPAAPAAPKVDPKQAAADKATEERHRRFLLGKKATRTIKMDNGIVIVEAGQDITEEVLQKAKLANKFIELSMNVQ